MVFIEDAHSKKAALDKRATALKAAGDMPAAINVLRQIKLLMGDDYDDTRLAKYLQAAGRNDEALSEIDWLLARVESYARAHVGHQPESTVLASIASKRYRLHKDAVMICKRARLAADHAEHERQMAHWHTEWRRLEAISCAEQRRKAEEFKAARQQGHAAVQAHLQKWRR